MSQIKLSAFEATTASVSNAMRPAGVLGGIRRKIGRVLAVHGERRSLRELDAHMLADIGITRAEAEAEGYRSLFDLPRR